MTDRTQARKDQAQETRAETRKRDEHRQRRRNLFATLRSLREFIAAENAKQPTESETKAYLSENVPGTKLTRQQLLEMDLKMTAFHEAGHFAVGMHFKAHTVQSSIWKTQEGATLKEAGFVGHTEVIAMPGAVRFRRAVLGWAGALAETLCDQPVANWRQDDLTELWEVRKELHTSPTDSNYIDAHPMRWRSFKTAADIIFRRRFELETVARDLQNIRHATAIKGKYIVNRFRVPPRRFIIS
jgi:hypothetical protein